MAGLHNFSPKNIEEKSKVNKIMDWLELPKTNQDDNKNAITKEGLSTIKNDELLSTHKFEVSTQKVDKDIPKDVIQSKADQLRSIAKYFENYEREMEYRETWIKEKQNKYEEKEHRIQILESQCEDMQKQLSKNNMTIFEKENEIGKLKQLVENANNEAKRREGTIAVVKSDYESTKTEEFNAIAQKLHLEYKDFKDGLEMDMSIELGNNMKYSLEKVFKILSRNGINVDGGEEIAR